jgi:Flp pilus assembly pilin Flp
MLSQFRRANRLTKLQYTLMGVFGSVAVVAGVAPISEQLKIAAVALAFGVTVGLWLSHLLVMVQDAVDGVDV